MADTNRTLDDILAEARSEPPVLTRDEAEQLIEHHPTPAGVMLPRIDWQRYLMTGMIIAAAAIVAVMVGTSGPDDSSRNGIRDARGVQSSTRVIGENTQPASPEHPAGAPVSGAPVAAGLDGAPANGESDQDPATKPTPGETSISWGYRFTEGQTLRYRIVTEVSDPAINDNYTQVREVSVHVVSVDNEGRAAVTITRLAETIDRRGAVEVPDIVILREARQPKVIHATVGRDGRSVVDRVEHDDDASSTMNVGGFVGQLFGALPDASVTVRRLVKDSSTSIYSIPSVDSNRTISMVDVRDTIRHTYALVGPRDIGGTPCSILVATRTETTAIDGAGRSDLTTTIDESYLRSSDGLPIRATSTSTRHVRGGIGSTHRTSLELIGEDTASGSGVSRPEVID